MLKELHIENYKSLRNVTIQFKDGLNIIIGKNGSGKSNLLEFIFSYFSHRPFIHSPRGNRKYSDYNFSFVISNHDSYGEYDLLVHATRDFKVKDEDDKVLKFITNATLTKIYISGNTEFDEKYSYTIPPLNKDELNQRHTLAYKLRSFIAEKVLITYGIPHKISWLDIPGSYEIDIENSHLYNESLNEDLRLNWSFDSSLEYLIHTSEIDFLSTDISNDIRKLFADQFVKNIKSNKILDNLMLYSPIEDVRMGNNVNVHRVDDKILIENLLIEFKVENNWVPWSYLSDGTKRLFYIIAEMSCQEEGLTLIEEPELGIHPHQLFKLMRFLKEQSVTKQIIISTHSPLILDTLESSELDRITIAKIKNGSSHFEKLTNEQMKETSNYIENVNDLSYYWLHHEELESND